MADARGIRIREPGSGLDVRLRLLTEKAPANAEFLWRYLAEERTVEALHAIYTGPELSFPLPAAEARAAGGVDSLPLEHATAFPAAGDLLLTYLPPRVWGGGAEPVFDLGLFYAPGGRTLLPVGLLPGSVCARVADADLTTVAAACRHIRRRGAVTLTLGRVPEGRA